MLVLGISAKDAVKCDLERLGVRLGHTVMFLNSEVFHALLSQIDSQ